MSIRSGVLCFLLLTIAACGGGGRDDVTIDLTGSFPEPIGRLAATLKLSGTLKSDDGTQATLLSIPAEGVSKEGGYRFQVEPIADLPREGGVFHVDLLYEETGVAPLIVATASVLGVNAETALSIPIDQVVLNTTIDDDSDGLENIREVLTGLNPRNRDSDGDGVVDAIDAFPLLTLESKDTDGDGVGDQKDDDIDGDGISNVDEDLRGTDRQRADSDSDGVNDRFDTCPLVTDIDQGDHDGDGHGNACDDDADGDGLSDERERELGTDPLGSDTDGDGLADGLEVVRGSNARTVDTDADGVSDPRDNCPIAFDSSQSDLDRDGLGDVCDGDRDADGIDNGSDNCPYTSNVEQRNTDGDGEGDDCDVDIDDDGFINDVDLCPSVANPSQLRDDADGDGVTVECDLDETDPLVRSATGAVFVDGLHGDDTHVGTMALPLRTLNAAIAKAIASHRDIYVAAGSYTMDTVTIGSAIRLFGGFLNSEIPTDRFATRNAQSADPNFRTELTRRNAAVSVALTSVVDTVLSGFSITNTSTEQQVARGYGTLNVSGGAPLIERCVISGNASSSAAALFLTAGTTASVVRSRIDGGGISGGGTQSVAVRMVQSQPSLTSNIIIAGRSRFVIGVDVEASQPLFVNNTVDARSGESQHGSAEGISLTDASPRLINNLLFTGTAPDQYVLSCWGRAPESSSLLRNNLLAVIAGEGTSPLVRYCDGTNFFDGDFLLGEAEVRDNIGGDHAFVTEIVDGEYRPVMGIDLGLAPAAGGASVDWSGNLRPQSREYDVGAIER